MSFGALLLILQLFANLCHFRVLADPFSYNISGFDVGPDWSKDPFPPYPPLTDGSGKLLDAANIRGTRLFGYTGCSENDRSIIDSTYNDFYRLTHIDGLWKNFAWNEQAAKEMWGVLTGPRPIPDERKEEIRRRC